MQGILKQMVGPWMRDPAPRESLKGSKKRIKGQSQRSLRRQIVAHYAKDAASWIDLSGQRSSHKISLVHGKAFQRRESNMKEDLILVWVAVSLSRHFLKGLQKRKPRHECGVIDQDRCCWESRIKTKDQGQDPNLQLWLDLMNGCVLALIQVPSVISIPITPPLMPLHLPPEPATHFLCTFFTPAEIVRGEGLTIHSLARISVNPKLCDSRYFLSSLQIVQIISGRIQSNWFNEFHLVVQSRMISTGTCTLTCH